MRVIVQYNTKQFRCESKALLFCASLEQSTHLVKPYPPMHLYFCHAVRRDFLLLPFGKWDLHAQAKVRLARAQKLKSMKHLLLIGIFYASCTWAVVQAQDQTFSQFYTQPQFLNPALVGSIQTSFRLAASYRDQWRGLVPKSFQTYATSLDLRWDLGLSGKAHQDAVAVGMFFYTDRVPTLDYVATQIVLSGAFHKSLDARNTQYLSLGIQGGIQQRNISYEDLTFQDQFNGTDGYTLSTSEDLPANNYAFSDFSVGLNYSMSQHSGLALYVGAAIHHITQPEVSFYVLGGDPGITYPSSKLYRKYTAHASMNLPLAERLDIVPRVLVARQGPHYEAAAGGSLRFGLSQFAPVALHLGAWAHVVGDVQTTATTNAMIWLVGMEYNNVLVGLSYDAWINALGTTRGPGVIELSISYLGEYENETVLCPKF